METSDWDYGLATYDPPIIGPECEAWWNTGLHCTHVTCYASLFSWGTKRLNADL